MKSSDRVPEKVYRYMPVHRLWEVLATKSLYFMNNSKWDDPFEGFLVKRYCKTAGRDYARLNADKFFLCCSIIQERDHQWRNYTPNKDGVVVSLNVKALLAAHQSIIIHKIRYPKRSQIGNLLSRMTRSFSDALILELFFIKNLAFEDEKEIRFLIQKASVKDDIVPVKINTKVVIEAILFDPRMDHRTYVYHRQFIKDQFGISNISHSSLYDPERRFPHSKG